ncbi:MAG: hypothetical protein LDL24_01375, partial [Treponema sp.]|nr:hypothetical protein [Treponema sp.]
MEQVMEDVRSLLPNTNKDIALTASDMDELCGKLSDAIKAMVDEKSRLELQLREAERKAEDLAAYKRSLDTLCPVHIPVDIDGRWNALIDREWGVVNKDALENLNKIKLMNDQNQEFISEVIKEFGEQQSTFTDFSQRYRINMEEYAKRAEGAKKAVLEELGRSSKKIEDTFAQFSQVEDVTEKIKMISLNLSIEASKVRGAESFSFLARELRRLAQSTEETTKGISLSIKDTVTSMKKSREEQVRDLYTMDSILQEFETLLKEYDDASGKLHAYMRRAIDRINENQEEQKTILLNFFRTLQQIAITKEELEHQIAFYCIFLKQTNDYVHKVLRSDKQCRGTSCPQRRYVLEELAKIANTDEERRMVNSLFK